MSGQSWLWLFSGVGIADIRMAQWGYLDYGWV